jgi:hypothetical protein
MPELMVRDLTLSTEAPANNTIASSRVGRVFCGSEGGGGEVGGLRLRVCGSADVFGGGVSEVFSSEG